MEAQESRSVAIDPDDIGGVVTSAQGPEAGVWVIAETNDLPTRFIRTVVTDDRGRYLLPDLPEADYEVFARGYGLVDSPRVSARPGRTLNVDAVVAPDARAASAMYPAASWLSLMEIPPGELPAEDVTRRVKSCMMCHQLGTQATREIPAAFGDFPSTLDAWDHRVRVAERRGHEHPVQRTRPATRAGWKGRGLWSSNMSYAIWHIEGEPGTLGGKGQKAKVAKFQFRPHPLAK